MMPPSISGVINLRGVAVPVMELSARLGRAPTGVTRRTCIVIVEVAVGGKQQSVGLIVDAVKAVIEIASEDVEPVPLFGAHVNTDLISGVAKVDGKFVILLKADRLVALEAVDATTAASAAG